MFSELRPYWEDLYSLGSLDDFLQEVKKKFDDKKIKEESIRLLHRYTQLENLRSKGVINNNDYRNEQASISDSAYKILSTIEETYLPILPVTAIAGINSGPQYAVEYREIEQWKKPKTKMNTIGRIGIRVEGNSMEPFYLDGDILVCRQIFIDEITQRQTIVIVENDNSIYLKRIKKKGSKLQLLSLNQDYEPFEIPIRDISEYWLVEQKIK